MTRTGKSLTVLALLAMLVLILPMSVASAQDNDRFTNLDADQRVYDDTGDSMSDIETNSLQRRLDQLESRTGANAVVYIRALDATSEETLEQVEALQQAWAVESGANEDVAVAILINRNPEDPEDARAGIFVGETFDDGNVPRDEQVAIVEQTLIPWLSQGQVPTAVTQTLDRLETAMVEGPSRSASAMWAANAGATWAPWVAVVLSLLGLAAAVVVFRRRSRIDAHELAPTTSRPDSSSPALGGALARGGASASSIPAVLLDLATRDVVAIEQETEHGRWSQGTVAVRLLDHTGVRGDIEVALWNALATRSVNNVISSKKLRAVTADRKTVLSVITARMKSNGWLDERAPSAQLRLGIITLVAFLLTIAGLVIIVVGDAPLMLVGIGASTALAVTAGTMTVRYSLLSVQGQRAAVPWRAYREGLKRAAKDNSIHLDLDAALPDVIALNVAGPMGKRLKEATASGMKLSAFSSPDSQALATSAVIWGSFNNSVSASAAGTTVSVGGAGGGGGAAGST